MNVYWTPLAEERARQIVASMKADRTGAAWRWLQAMLGRVHGISKYDNLGEGLRESYFSPCRIIYRVESDRIVILTLHAVGRLRKSARYEERPRGEPRVSPDRS